MVDTVLHAVKALQAILDDAKENVHGGLHLRLCNAAQVVYDAAEALKEEEEEGSNDDEEEEEEESDPEPAERTENDMELNELAELWEWQFDYGRRGAVMDLDFLIETIVGNDEAKRVCAAVRVLNRAVRGSKPDDPADAERILEWKEDLVEGRAIRVCGEILERTDDRGFHDETHEEHWLYSCIGDEILELFQRLGESDALFRTKLRRNGALKAVEDYSASGLGRQTDVLDMLKRR